MSRAKTHKTSTLELRQHTLPPPPVSFNILAPLSLSTSFPAMEIVLYACDFEVKVFRYASTRNYQWVHGYKIRRNLRSSTWIRMHNRGCNAEIYFEPTTIFFLRCPYRNRPTQVWPYYRPYTCRTNTYLYGFVHSRGRIQFTRLKLDKLN